MRRISFREEKENFCRQTIELNSEHCDLLCYCFIFRGRKNVLSLIVWWKHFRMYNSCYKNDNRRKAVGFSIWFLIWIKREIVCFICNPLGERFATFLQVSSNLVRFWVLSINFKDIWWETTFSTHKCYKIAPIKFVKWTYSVLRWFQKVQREQIDLFKLTANVLINNCNKPHFSIQSFSVLCAHLRTCILYLSFNSSVVFIFCSDSPQIWPWFCLPISFLYLLSVSVKIEPQYSGI